MDQLKKDEMKNFDNVLDICNGLLLNDIKT